MRFQVQGLPLAATLALAQFAIGVISALVVWFASNDTLLTKAALYGSIVAALPTFYMGLRSLTTSSEADPRQIVGGFYRGQVGKFAMTLVLFAIGVKLFAAQFVVLIGVYMLCLLTYWVAFGLSIDKDT